MRNQLLPSQQLPLSPSLSVFGVLMLIRRRGGVLYGREAREGEREREEQIFPPSFLPPSFVSRFGTVPIYLSIFCAMHFSAKLTPSFSAASTSPFSPSFRCFYAHFPSIYLAALVDTRAFFMNPTSAAPPPLSSVINLI